MNDSLILSTVPAEIWNLLDGFLVDSNLIFFLLQNENKLNLQLDRWKLEYLWKRKNPKIMWMPPSTYFPNVRLGYNYFEFKILKNSATNNKNDRTEKYETKIEYLPDVIVQNI